ncbi:integrase, partial [Bifidobacterium longum subsp. infantis]
DVMAMLPYLAAYMGHAGIDSTLYYVHASPDFMDGYADLVADAERVVPETEEP